MTAENSATIYVKDLCEQAGCSNQIGIGQGLLLHDLRGLRLRFCSYAHAAIWCARMAGVIDEAPEALGWKHSLANRP